MVKIEKVTNAKIDNAMANLGKGVQPLSNAEYEKLIKIYKSMKSDSEIVKFDDQTDVMVFKIPENAIIRERVLENKTMYSVPLVYNENNEEKFTNILVDEDEKVQMEALLGCKLVIVGKRVDTEGKKGTKDEGKVFVNIRKYRGSFCPDYSEDNGDANDNVEI